MRIGRKSHMESIVDSVLEEMQKRGAQGSDAAEGALDTAGKAASQARKSAGKAIKDAEVGDKVDRILEFIEDNTTILAKVGKKLASDAAKEAPGAAAAVGGAVSGAAETVGDRFSEVAGAGADAIEDALETLGKEVLQPTVRYGRGLRHGLLIGAAIAMLYTPWPGKILRDKLTSLGREAVDLVEAMRAGAADTD
ncbi:MAG: hypothetical protein ABR573_10540 [Candidatus Dormibacteria bacterium]